MRLKNLMDFRPKIRKKLIDDLVDMFTDEICSGYNPKISKYMNKLQSVNEKEKQELYELLLVTKIMCLTKHPELNEKKDEENLTNLLKQIKPKK